MLPDKYESGTLNGVGIAGLGAGVSWVKSRSVETIRSHEAHLTELLLDGLREIPEVVIYGTANSEKCTAVVSCRVEGQLVSEVGLQLDDDFDILCRVGLHCAPSAHRTIGTFPEGTIRLAPGIFSSPDDINKVIKAFQRIASHYG